jgi:pyrroloquinoline quinone biosynthesis protein D
MRSKPIERKIPNLKPGLRYTLDRDRGVWLLHTQQGTLLPPPESTEIMGLMDGQRDIGAIVEHIADASGRAREEVAVEVQRFLAEMQQRGVVVLN